MNEKPLVYKERRPICAGAPLHWVASFPDGSFTLHHSWGAAMHASTMHAAFWENFRAGKP